MRAGRAIVTGAGEPLGHCAVGRSGFCFGWAQRKSCVPAVPRAPLGRGGRRVPGLSLSGKFRVPSASMHVYRCRKKPRRGRARWRAAQPSSVLFPRPSTCPLSQP